MTPQERDEIKQFVREVIFEAAPLMTHESVKETLTAFGFTVNDANSMQQDMAHLRRLRVGSEYVKSTTVKTCLGAMITGMIFLLGLGLKDWVKKQLGL
jgi:hypothetical protein